MENLNLWETTVIRDVTQEDGNIKAQTEHYLVLSLSCTDAEKRIIEELAPLCCGDMKVTDIKTRKFREILPSEDESDDKWYVVKAYIITINEKTGEEKRTAVQYLVQASDLKKAIRNYEHSMEGSMVDFELDDVKFSPILEVFSLPEGKVRDGSEL